MAAHGADGFHCRRVLGIQEQQRQPVAPEIDGKENDCRVSDTQHRAVPNALMDSLRLACAQILSGEGCRSSPDGVIGAGAEHKHLAACGDRSHGAGAQTVDGGLQQDAADGGDGILQSHRQTHAQQMPCIDPAQMQVLPAQVQQREPFHHKHKAQHTGDKLTQQGCPPRAGNAHMEAHNEQHIQRHVQKTGQNQKYQRCTGIAQRTNDAGQQVIQHGGGDSQEDYPDIAVSIGKGFLGIVHPAKDLSAQGGGDQGDGQGNDGAQPDHVAHKPPQSLKVLLPEFLRHRDGKTGTDTVAHAQHHEVDGAGGAHTSQRLYSQKFAYDYRIHHAVKLLEQHTEQQRQHEGQNQLHGGANGQITCCIFLHSITSKQEKQNIIVRNSQYSTSAFVQCQWVSEYFFAYLSDSLFPIPGIFVPLGSIEFLSI